MRRVDRQTRHFKALKRRVDSIDEKLAGESQLVQAELFRDEVGVSDEFVTVVDGQVSVETIEAQNISEDSADLVGELVALGNSSSADVGHEYREDNTTDSYTQTATTNLTSPQQYTFSISGLDSGTDYEFRALADGSDGSSDTGALVTFTTAGDLVIDDFERGNLDPYTTPTDFAITTDSTYVRSGTYALRNATGNVDKIYSTSGLNDYPQPGNRFEFWTYHEGGQMQMLFGGPDGDNCYNMQVTDGGDLIRVFRFDAGSLSILSESSIAVPSNGYIRGVVDWGANGTLRLTLEDTTGTIIGVVEAVDTTYSDTGFGWRGNDVAADDAKVIGDAVGHATGTLDDFEDDDIAEYQGATNDFITQSSITHNNSDFALKHDSDGFDALYAYDQVNGVGPVRRGDTVECWVYGDSSVEATPTCGFMYGVQDDANYYVASIIPGGTTNSGAANFSVRAIGDVNLFASSDAVAYDTDEWYRIEIDWATDGTHTVTTYDSTGTQIEQISGTNTAYGGGGFGFRGDIGSIYDDVVLS